MARAMFAVAVAVSTMVSAASAADFGGGGVAGVAMSRGYIASPGLGQSDRRDAAGEAAPAPFGLRGFDVDFTASASTAPDRPVDR